MTAQSDGEEYFSRQGAALHPIERAEYEFSFYKALQPLQLAPDTWYTAYASGARFFESQRAFTFDVMVNAISSSTTTVFARISFNLILFNADLNRLVSQHTAEMDDIGNWVISGQDTGVPVHHKERRRILDVLRFGYITADTSEPFDPRIIAKEEQEIPREMRPPSQQRPHWALPVEENDKGFTPENFIEHN